MSASPRTKKERDERGVAAAILLEIIHQSGGIFNGRTRLYKAFYIAHLYHFKDTSQLLSNWPVVHMPQGHGIDEGEAIIREMERDGLIKRAVVYNGPYREDSYTAIPASGPGLLDSRSIESIGKAVAFIDGKTARELSTLSHEQFSYLNGQSGQELHIYLDLLSDEERENEFEEMGRVERLMGGGIGDAG